MTISKVVGQATGVSVANDNNAATKAFPGNITSGNTIFVLGMRYTTSSKAFVAGDCTKSAGTATIGSIALDSATEYNVSAGNYLQIGIWSASVTGTGSATMQLAAGGGGSYQIMAIDEAHSDVGAISFVAGSNKAGSGATGAPATASGSSTTNAIFMAAVATITSGATTHTPGLTYSQIYEEEDGASYQTGNAEYKIVTGATSSTADWQAPTTVPWAAALAVYQEPAAGTAVPVFVHQLQEQGIS